MVALSLTLTRDVGGELPFAGGVPAGAVQEQDSVCAGGAADLLEMDLHGMGVGNGIATAAPVPRAGQTAPNRWALW